MAESAENVITGRTRGASRGFLNTSPNSTPKPASAVGAATKVCPRDVFELVERAGVVEDDDDFTTGR